jgi:hypothetical protein
VNRNKRFKCNRCGFVHWECRICFSKNPPQTWQCGNCYLNRYIYSK